MLHCQSRSTFSTPVRARPQHKEGHDFFFSSGCQNLILKWPKKKRKAKHDLLFLPSTFYITKKRSFCGHARPREGEGSKSQSIMHRVDLTDSIILHSSCSFSSLSYANVVQNPSPQKVPTPLATKNSTICPLKLLKCQLWVAARFGHGHKGENMQIVDHSTRVIQSLQSVKFFYI